MNLLLYSHLRTKVETPDPTWTRNWHHRDIVDLLSHLLHPYLKVQVFTQTTSIYNACYKSAPSAVSPAYKELKNYLHKIASSHARDTDNLPALLLQKMLWAFGSFLLFQWIRTILTIRFWWSALLLLWNSNWLPFNSSKDNYFCLVHVELTFWNSHPVTEKSCRNCHGIQMKTDRMAGFVSGAISICPFLFWVTRGPSKRTSSLAPRFSPLLIRSWALAQQRSFSSWNSVVPLHDLSRDFQKY